MRGLSLADFYIPLIVLIGLILVTSCSNIKEKCEIRITKKVCEGGISDAGLKIENCYERHIIDTCE